MKGRDLGRTHGNSREEKCSTPTATSLTQKLIFNVICYCYSIDQIEPCSSAASSSRTFGPDRFCFDKHFRHLFHDMFIMLTRLCNWPFLSRYLTIRFFSIFPVLLNPLVTIASHILSPLLTVIGRTFFFPRKSISKLI